MTNSIDVVADQSTETNLNSISDKSGLTIRYSYKRSADTRENNKNGQDYLTFHLQTGKVIFALCDGVSQSFYGDIGSRILGNRLMNWMKNEIPLDDFELLPKNEEKNQIVITQLANNLSKQLELLKQEATEEIFQRDISHITNPWLREELEDRRKNCGTHSNFTCGIVEAPKNNLPFGRILLFWLGDAKLRWYVGMNDETELLGGKWISSERWSSKDGVIGESIHGYMNVTHKVSTLIAHSDGMDPFPTQWYQPFLNFDLLNAHFSGLQERPNNDDVSFIEINLQNSVYPFLSRDHIVESQNTKIPSNQSTGLLDNSRIKFDNAQVQGYSFNKESAASSENEDNKSEFSPVDEAKGRIEQNPDLEESRMAINERDFLEIPNPTITKGFSPHPLPKNEDSNIDLNTADAKKNRFFLWFKSPEVLLFVVLTLITFLIGLFFGIFRIIRLP